MDTYDYNAMIQNQANSNIKCVDSIFKEKTKVMTKKLKIERS